jgi:hypothetical protein
MLTGLSADDHLERVPDRLVVESESIRRLPQGVKMRELESTFDPVSDSG